MYRSLQLVEFDMESAIASLKAGEPVIPVWLDLTLPGLKTLGFQAIFL
ncbi:hypothetical protein [Limnofasciculus baicalensis]|nr:hypothetical protein [Limnofasciculus baicalensis]